MSARSEPCSSFMRMFREQTVSAGNNIIVRCIRFFSWTDYKIDLQIHCSFPSVAGVASYSGFARMHLYCQGHVSWTFSHLFQCIQGSWLCKVFPSWSGALFFSLLLTVPSKWSNEAELFALHQPPCSTCLFVSLSVRSKPQLAIVVWTSRGCWGYRKQHQWCMFLCGKCK